jgi:hypothetical protein
MHFPCNRTHATTTPIITKPCKIMTYDRNRMVEAAGIEPASLGPSSEASTHIVYRSCLVGRTSMDRSPRRPARMPGVAGFPVCDLAAPRRVSLSVFAPLRADRPSLRRCSNLYLGCHCVCRFSIGMYVFARGFTRPPDNLGAQLQLREPGRNPFAPILGTSAPTAQSAEALHTLYASASKESMTNQRSTWVSPKARLRRVSMSSRSDSGRPGQSRMSSRGVRTAAMPSRRPA